VRRIACQDAGAALANEERKDDHRTAGAVDPRAGYVSILRAHAEGIEWRSRDAGSADNQNAYGNQQDENGTHLISGQSIVSGGRT
jgi:hypothetical protein